MKHEFQDPDLIELDHIWPIGQLLQVPDNGIIVVAGGYRGRYLHYLHEMFPMATIYGFEPQPSAFLEATKRLYEKQNVIVLPSGLATANRKVMIGNSGTDGASILSPKGKVITIEVRDAVEALHYHTEGRTIDLFVLNIEGYEFSLIPYLLNEGMHHRITAMAVQFHPEYVAPEHYNRVQVQMRESYVLRYSDTNNWTYWERKHAD